MDGLSVSPLQTPPKGASSARRLSSFHTARRPAHPQGDASTQAELHRATPARISRPLPTPSTSNVPSAARGRRVSIAPRRLTQVKIHNPRMTGEELAEMYSTTIKLCQDNKINAKNTWSLNLIDYMGMLVKDMEDEDAVAVLSNRGDTNFQMAGITLDAGVRIYCSRVDSVHSNAFKVLGSLSRTGKNNKENDNHTTSEDKGDQDGEDELTDDDSAKADNAKRKKRGTRKGESTLESNPAALLQSFPETTYFDPLFQKMSAAFDEGGAKGMLLNNLAVNNMCEIIFDSSESALNLPSSSSQVDAGNEESALKPQEHAAEESETKSASRSDSAYDLISLLPPAESGQPNELCPRFMQFYRSRKEQYESHPAEQNSEPAKNPSLPENDNDDLGVPDLDDRDVSGSEAFDSITFSEPHIGDDDDDSAFILNGFNDRNELIKPEVGRLVLSGKMNLMEAGVPLAQDSEYSFFDSTALRNWAGPQHWHFRGIPATNPAATGNPTGNKRRRGKTAMLLDFKSSPNFDFAAEFARAKEASCQLTTAVREGFSENKVTLPDDLQYKTETLARLFLKPIRLRNPLKRDDSSKMGVAVAKVDDTSSAWYSFDNEGDADNFCLVDDDTDTGIGLDAEHDGVRNVQDPDPIAGRTSRDDWDMSCPSSAPVGAEIDFGIVAKEVDVKQLQLGLWEQIRGNFETNNDKAAAISNRHEDNPQHQEESETMAEHTTTLRTLVETMPAYVPKHSLEDVTLPYIFICLLHLANEKTLSILPAEDGSLGDLLISKALDKT